MCLFDLVSLEECCFSFKIVLVMYFLEWLYSDSEEEDKLDDSEDEEELLLGLLPLWLLFLINFCLELLPFN